jgi:hypothetical protein
VETTEVTCQEPERLFDVGFWLACEREAARMLETITGADDEQVGRP